MLPLGTVAPDFMLPDVVSGKAVSLRDILSEKGTVIVFMCNHCPYVLHVLDELLKIAGEYQARGISFAGISANDVAAYPDDSPENMRLMALNRPFPFPYLYDETQEVARAYQAACTPDFYVFNGKQECVYRGRMDESTPGNGKPVTGLDLRQALDALLAGRTPDAVQFPSMGCNIKWKSK